MTTDITENILRDIQRRLRTASDNAEHDRALIHRAIGRMDAIEERLAADIREIRADVAAIDVKLVSLANIENDIRTILETLGESDGTASG